MSLGLLLIPSWLSRWAEGTLPPRFAVTEERAGTLALPSGRIVVHGLVSGSVLLALPFARAVPAGSHELVRGMLRDRVAFAAIRFSTEKPATWEAAQWDFTGIADVANRKQWMRVEDGVPVFDIGNGNTCFTDGKSARDHDRWVTDTKGGIALRLLQRGLRDAAFLEAMKEARAREAPDPLDELVENERCVSLPRGGNAISIRPGSRMRGYSSFFGLDSRGAPAVFVTSFSMIHLAPAAERGAAILAAWEEKKLIEIARYARREPFAIALCDQLDLPRTGNADLAEWLFDRSEVSDVHAIDDMLRSIADAVDDELVAARYSRVRGY